VAVPESRSIVATVTLNSATAAFSVRVEKPVEIATFNLPEASAG
jgi:hypothetical protein